MSDTPSFSSPQFGAPTDTANTFSAGDYQLEETRKYIDDRILMHSHNGVESSRTDIDSIQGLFEVVSAVPTGTPKDVYDQIKIYVNGGTRRLYVFENSGNSWRYTTLT